MKPGQYALIAAAGLALAGGFAMLKTSSTTGEEAASQAINAGATADSAKADATRPKAVEAKPEVFFLDEAGTNAPENRPTANRLPPAKGTKRIGNIRAVTSLDEGNFMAPSWSPDGLELMFSKAGYSGLYTKGILGGELNQITGKDNVGFDAKWNKDGKIATKTNDGETQEFNPDGSPANSINPVDNSSITGAFNANDTVFYRQNPGEAPVPVSTGEDRYFGGVVSPDGKYIAYSGLETGIYVKPLDGSAPAINVGFGSHPSFTPDGASVVYTVATDDGHHLVGGEIFMSSVNGGEVHNLTGDSPAIETKPAVSPDGNTIAYESDGVIFVGTIQ